MPNCPCCSNVLLRHIRHHQLTYFCQHCWQDMPALDQLQYEFSAPSFSQALGVPAPRLPRTHCSSSNLKHQLRLRQPFSDTLAYQTRSSLVSTEVSTESPTKLAVQPTLR